MNECSPEELFTNPSGLEPVLRERIEQLLGVRLPDGLFHQLDRLLGATADPQLVFKVGADNESAIDCFLTQTDIVEQLQLEMLHAAEVIGLPIVSDAVGGRVILRHTKNFDVVYRHPDQSWTGRPPTILAKDLSSFVSKLTIDDFEVTPEMLEGVTVHENLEWEKNIRELEERTGLKLMPPDFD